MPQDYILARLLNNNAEWAREVERDDPGFFERSAHNPQTPKVLYIGCSDSRVPESVATLSKPGDIFVHRNIANQCLLHDDNALAVLTYALAALPIKHIIVAGHTGCGGVKAALAAAHTCPAPPLPVPLQRWLVPLTELARGFDRDDVLGLVKANVCAQVENILRTDAVKVKVADGGVQVHGWVYELETGRFHDLGISEGKFASDE